MNIFPIILNKKASDKIKYRFHKVQKTDKINHNVSRDKIIKSIRYPQYKMFQLARKECHLLYNGGTG